MLDLLVLSSRKKSFGSGHTQHHRVLGKQPHSIPHIQTLLPCSAKKNRLKTKLNVNGLSFPTCYPPPFLLRSLLLFLPSSPSQRLFGRSCAILVCVCSILPSFPGSFPGAVLKIKEFLPGGVQSRNTRAPPQGTTKQLTVLGGDYTIRANSFTRVPVISEETRKTQDLKHEARLEAFR